MTTQDNENISTILTLESLQKEYEKEGDYLFDRLYLKGRDIYNNIFPNHQR